MNSKKFANNTPPIFCKIKSTPETRGYSEAPLYEPSIGILLSDDTLCFTYEELGGGSDFEITCRAFFTGAPPIVEINEPSYGFGAGYYPQPKIYKLTNQSGRVVVSDQIENVRTLNDAYSDSIEPMTYYEFDSEAAGYFVEIKFRGGLSEDDLTNPAAPFGSAHYLRWASTIENQETTMQSGIIIAKKLG
jgi:hypothetical protein